MNDNIKVINFNKNVINNFEKDDIQVSNQNNNNLNMNSKTSSNITSNTSSNTSSNIISNTSSNTSSNINEIIFDSNNSISNNFFKKNEQNVIIEENVALDNKDLIYKDDTIYIQELENELLSTYPVTKQNNKYIIEKVQDVSKNLIQLKNEALERYELLKKNIDYKKKLEIINNNFSDNWVIPIVNDSHIIFENISNDTILDNNNIEDKLLTQLKENSTYSQEISQKDLLKELNENNQNFEDKKINIMNYHEILSKLYTSNKIKYDHNNINNRGYVIHPKQSMNTIRFSDLQNNNWSTNVATNNLTIPENIYDEDGKIIGIEHKTLVKSENQNIYGFLVLKNGRQDILKDYNDILYDTNYSNHLYQVLYDKKEINKINQIDKNKIQIESDIHSFNDNTIIYIKNSNCYPSIDGFYNTSQNLKIIDSNKIEIQFKNNLIFEGNSGFLYKLSKIKYDYYNVTDDLNMEFMHTTYDNNKEDKNHNKMYIFTDVNMNKYKYVNILKNIIPNIHQIIENEKENLEKCFQMNHIKDILSNYHIKINEINDEQYQIILDYLHKNIETIQNEFVENKIYEKINYFYKNIEYLKNNNYYLNDDYLLDKEVEKYYGIYPYKNSSFDSIGMRYNWLKDKDDKGELFTRLLSLKNQEKNKIQIKYVENKLKQIKDNIKKIENTIKKEEYNNKTKCNIYQYTASKINDDLHIDTIDKIDNNYYFYNNELYLYKDNELYPVKDIKEDNLLLILENNELWSYQNKKWIFTKEYSKYNKLKYLCEFKNLELDKIDLDSLDCIYRKDFGCLSKTVLRNKIKLTEYQELYTSFQKLYENLKSNKKINNLKNNINYYTSKYDYQLNKNKNNNKKLKKINMNVKVSNSSITIPVDILIKKIFKISNIDLRNNYFYQLIDKDLFFIDNQLYSKKYKKEVLCGHYYYLKKIYYSDNENLRQKFIDKLISIFSDQGESQENLHTCKSCGEVLFNNDYDETEGFAASGALIMSREIWVKEKALNLSKESIDEYLESNKVIDCQDEKFKELLLKNGLNIENLDKAIDLCSFITYTLYPKIGVQLSNGVLINNIIEIIQKIDMIIPFHIYKFKEKNKLLQAGISQKRIETMENKKYFEKKYKIFYEIKKQTIICARLLISIQVNIPNLILKNKTTTCQFNGFNEKDGIDFMACILKEVNSKVAIEKEDILGLYKKSIQEYYNDYKSFHYIKQQFQEKKDYLQSLKKDEIYSEKINYGNKIKIKFDNIPEKIDINVHNKLKSIKNIDEFKILFKKIKSRSIYVNNEIIDLVNELISKSELSDKLPSLLEKSCCAQDVSTYIDFYQYFQLFDENNKIFELIEESKKLTNILNETKLINYSYHRFRLYNEDIKVSINNDIVIYDGKNVSQNFMNSIFSYYVDEGVYQGTPRNYVEEYKGISDKNTELKDIKSGKSYQEIISKEYSIDELNLLLKSIEQNNMKFLNNVTNEDNKFDEEFINTLKKESINGLGIQINLLISNLVNINGKSKEYENKLFQIIDNQFSFDFDDNNMTIKDKIRKTNSINNQKLDYYKKIYNKISKYLSIIKNMHEFDNDKKLNIIEEPSKRSEMKASIIEENNKFNNLKNPEISKKFENIEMKYDIQKINSIFGKSNITSKDGNKVLKYSNFNNNDAAILMSYIIFEQLNLLFETDEEYVNKIVLYQKTTKNKYIAQFIEIIFNEMEEDYELFNICNKNNEFEHLDARFYNAYQLKIITSDQKYEIKDFLKTVSESRGVSTDKTYSTLEDEQKVSEEKKDILDSIKDEKKFKKIKQEIIDNDEEELDLITLKQIKQQIDDENENEKEVEIDGFINDGELKNKNILDTGSEYGSLAEFDFETGEGFPDAEYN